MLLFDIICGKRDSHAFCSKKEEQGEEDLVPIRVMEVMLFRNYSFTSTAGVGSTVLRGKWDITGEERDGFWMKISRFGFGRSVSGSTFR